MLASEQVTLMMLYSRVEKNSLGKFSPGELPGQFKGLEFRAIHGFRV